MRLPVFLSALLVALGAAQASGETKLAGTTWLMSSAGKRAPSISFASDGKVAGSGGCNRFFGSYMQEGEKLSFSPLGSTRMACPQGIMKRERAFFAMLKAVKEARIEGSTLLLIGSAGRELARLSRRRGE